MKQTGKFMYGVYVFLSENDEPTSEQWIRGVCAEYDVTAIYLGVFQNFEKYQIFCDDETTAIELGKMSGHSYELF